MFVSNPSLYTRACMYFIVFNHDTVTTDVQAVFLSRVAGITYSIRCAYLVNSDATACRYVIVSAVQGLDSTTGVVARNSSSIIELANAGCYDEVVAYDYGDYGEGTTSNTVSIRASINLGGVCRFKRQYTPL